jgi:hypothetical protein
MLTIDQALARLPNAKREGGRYRAACPAHGGKDRNLSVWADENGIACFKCWSHGCSTAAIVEALGGAPAQPRVTAPASSPPGADKREHQEAALRIWRE